ncbi:MAG: Error-prone repair protein ImuA [Lunatimonas sp.]|nr:Error-prone repair protein ImuA [Lunatimonas sp.]
MKLTSNKIERLRQLRQEVMALEGSLPRVEQRAESAVKLGPMEVAFPGRTFPLGANHEFISTTPSEAAATQGFVASLLGMLLRKGGYCLWIGNRRLVFPPALQLFGIAPHRVVFVDLVTEKEVLWTLEQALKCDALAAVVGELRELGFADSQRLQLAVERSRVTGFLLRHRPRSLHATACNTRWKITSLPSQMEGGLPGVGFPTWNVELLKVRNGRPGAWKLEWSRLQGFCSLPRQQEASRRAQEGRRYA